MLEILVLYLLLGSRLWQEELHFLVFFGLVVVYSAIWVGLDLRALYRRKGIKRTRAAGDEDDPASGEPQDTSERLKSPFPWIAGVVVSWTVALPAYLYQRSLLSDRRDVETVEVLTRGLSGLKSNVSPRRPWLAVLWSLTYGAAAVALVLALSIAIVQWLQRTMPIPANSGDRVDLMLGTVTVALMMLTLLAAIATLLGWRSLTRSIAKEARKSIDREAKTLHLEIGGSSRLIAAQIFHRLSLPSGKYSRNTDKERAFPLEAVQDYVLQDWAIKEARTAVYKLSGASASRTLWIAKNNLAYYLALRGAPADVTLALELASELYREHLKNENFVYLSTYYRVKMQYSEDWKELQEIREELDDVVRNQRKVLDLDLIEHLDLYRGVFRALDPKDSGDDAFLEDQAETIKKLARRLDGVKKSATGTEAGGAGSEPHRRTEDKSRWRKLRAFFGGW